MRRPSRQSVWASHATRGASQSHIIYQNGVQATSGLSYQNGVQATSGLVTHSLCVFAISFLVHYVVLLFINGLYFTLHGCWIPAAPLLPGAPTKTRASVVWCRGSQPKHVSNPDSVIKKCYPHFMYGWVPHQEVETCLFFMVLFCLVLSGVLNLSPYFAYIFIVNIWGLSDFARHVERGAE